MSDLGKRIREKRVREGLSLREAGAASDVAFSTLGRIENGGETTVKIAQKVEAWLNGEAPILPPPPMTLRDWFAGQAVAALIAQTNVAVSAARLATEAYTVADAMLSERRKTRP